jgi:Holliday junction resolvase
MRERDFGRQIETMLDFYGWLWKHDETAVRPGGGFATAFRGSRGFPDYIAVKGDRLLFIELKSERGRLSDDQRRWLRDLDATGKAEVYVWRPADLADAAKVLG